MDQQKDPRKHQKCSSKYPSKYQRAMDFRSFVGSAFLCFDKVFVVLYWGPLSALLNIFSVLLVFFYSGLLGIL
jgi:hypothetical protein